MKQGDKILFKLYDISAKEWAEMEDDPAREDELIFRDGTEAVITGFESVGEGYHDIRFEDGFELDAVSDYHFVEMEEEMEDERTVVYLGEGSEVTAEDFLEEILGIVELGQSFKFENTTAKDLRNHEIFGGEDYSDSELEDCSDLYITVVH